MTRIAPRSALTALVLAAAFTASAQPAPETASQRYERTVDECNAGTLPAPAREACIRNAGLALDATRRGAPTETEVQSSDGRATIIAPAGSRTPLSGSDTRTSDDGRAVIVLPADRTPAR